MTGDVRDEARRIVILLHDFYAGGAERIAITLGNRWQAMGRDVTILCGSEDGPFRARVANDVRVTTVNPPIPQGTFSRIRLGFACVPALRTLAADVVFAPGNFHLPVIGIAARGHYDRRPVFACKLSNRLQRPGRSWPAQRIFNVTTRMWASRLDGVAAMSPNLGNEARATLHGRPVECLWQPCITQKPGAPGHHPARSDGPRILVAGRLVVEKDISLALRTAAIVAQRQSIHVEIVGAGPLRPQLERESRDLGIADRVDFAGHVSDIRPYLAEADVLLSTSRYEGYPAVIVEALAAHVPVVATDSSPAIPEILFDPSFGAVAAAAPETLAAALESVRHTRPAGTAVARLVERHRADRSACAYLDWFDRLRTKLDRPLHGAARSAKSHLASD